MTTLIDERKSFSVMGSSKMLQEIQNYLWNINISASLNLEDGDITLEWWGHDGSLCTVGIEDDEYFVYKNLKGHQMIDSSNICISLDNLLQSYPDLFI